MTTFAYIVLEPSGKETKGSLAAESREAAMDKEQQSDALSRLVSGIVRSADFFKSDHTDVPITQVVLMGTCSRLAGLRQVVQEETEIDTVLITDVEGIRFVANSPEGVSAYISCIGSLVAPLDLLPEEYNARSQKRKSRDAQRDPIRTGIIIACACAAVGIVISALAVARYAINVSAEKKMQARISELSYVQDVYDTYVAYKKTDDSLTVAEGYASDKNSQLVAFLSELEMKMPSSILVLSATCDEKGVTMNLDDVAFNLFLVKQKTADVNKTGFSDYSYLADIVLHQSSQASTAVYSNAKESFTTLTGNTTLSGINFKIMYNTWSYQPLTGNVSGKLVSESRKYRIYQVTIKIYNRDIADDDMETATPLCEFTTSKLQ